MNIYKISAIILFTLFCLACSANENASDANQFWSTFRQAVVDNNKERIASITRFPFEVRGPDDSDPVIRYDRKGFLAIYERLVAQSVYMPSEGKIVPKSMRQLISDKQELSPQDYLTSDAIQFHQFEFERIEGRWYFSRAFLEE